MVCTAWPQFTELDLSRLKDVMTIPAVVDGRNLFEPEAMHQAGFTYLPTGWPEVNL